MLGIEFCVAPLQFGDVAGFKPGIGRRNLEVSIFRPVVLQPGGAIRKFVQSTGPMHHPRGSHRVRQGRGNRLDPLGGEDSDHQAIDHGRVGQGAQNVKDRPNGKFDQARHMSGG